jgi:DNA-directed RNA polymerase II subunit RPB2
MSLKDVMLTEDDHIAVMASYFAEKGPAFHQFDSYKHLVDKMIQEIIDETPSLYINTKTTQYRATFGQVYIERACFVNETRTTKYIYPQEARLRDLTYESPVFVDIVEEFWELNESGEFEKVNTIDHRKILLMKIPVMVRSSLCNLYKLSMDECIQKGECPNDPGGYFIINGKERVLVCQERLNYNQVYMFESNDDKTPHISEIRSMSKETGHSVLVQAKMSKDGKNICFSLPYMSKDIAAGAVFKALNMNSQDIARFIQPSTKEEHVLVDRLIRESIAYTNKEKAIKYISKACMNKVEDDEERCIIYTEQVIENELFPHMGISTPIEKCIILGDMLNKLFRVFLKMRLEDDRDNVSLKRIEGPGVLIGDLFRMSMKRYCDNLKKYLEKRQDIITAMNRTNSITAVLKHTFSTGNWAAQKNTYVRTGVSQVINHLTYPGTISHLRRVVIPVGKEGKNVKIRQIHPSQAFFIDIIESPEGKSIGIVKNLALLCNITTGVNPILTREMIEKCDHIMGCESYFDRTDWWRVYLNGTLIGISYQPVKLHDELRELRELNVFSSQVSFYMDKDDREIRVFCDAGRYIRPVLKVEPGNILSLTKRHITDKVSWSDLLDNDIVRYIDSNEVENSLIAMNAPDLIKYGNHNYDYCEIHPSAMLGVCSAVIPYPEHNQSPRLVYQASMVKQALGVYSLAFQHRFEAVTHVMHYPQKPMVSTKFDSMLKYDEMLTGCNPIVAIATYGGWNQEDSVMLNRSAVDRGMFVHTCYKTLIVEEHKKTNNSFEKIEVPPPSAQNKTMNYSKLGPNGIVKKGVPVNKGDIIIGKTLTKVQKDEDDKTDCSLAIGNGEEGVVDEIWEGLNEDGYKMIKIRIRQLRTPEVGDKFASRSSQKGVCGLLLSQEDMPFTESGMSPDIIINPHCFTSDNQVSLYNGLSRKIVDMKKGEGVWSYDYEKKGLTCRNNMGMEWKGFRKVVKMTMQDGRTIRCTPDHKFFTTDQKWVEAKDLDLNNDKIIMGLDGVEDVNYGDEDGWKLETQNFTFSCDSLNEREKSMAFARILGHVLTDGCVHKRRDRTEFKCPVNFGHLIDAEICIQDIYLITGKTPKICTSGKGGKASTYILYLPYELCQSIGLLEGVTIGRKTRQDSEWPVFVHDCPKSILREFLASMFGGDGHAPYIQGRNVSRPVGVKFTKSIHEDFKESFETKMYNLCTLLNRFDVGANIERVREYRNDSDELFYSYYVNIKNSLKFAQTIGFRYCTEKMGRLCVYKSYMEFQERVKGQSERILSLVDKHSVNTSVNLALENARVELLNTEPALNEYYSLSSMNQIGNRRKKDRSSDVLHLSYRYFPTFSEYLEQIGCLGWYSKNNYITERSVNELPTFYMRPIRIDEDGEDDVYCIGVEEFHNFICSGGITHNCIPSRMTMSQMIEMLLGKTGALAGKLGDATAFTANSINPVESIAKQLASFGFERHGSERLISGFTGEMMEAEIFIGTAYYQRLKHLVKDKLHSRARGNVTMMHHQPSEGRSKDGGLRTGRTILLVIVQIATLC